MSTDRREFLGAMLGASLLGRSGDFPPSSPGARQSPDWDLSWTQRLRGEHRAAFDWAQPDGSIALWRAGIWKQQVTQAFGVKDEDVSAVLVIRHSAIPVIMGDGFWSRHQVGKKRKVKDEKTGKPATRNPYRQEIETFIKNGGIVLGCGFAFGMMVGLEATLQKKKAAEVRPEVLTQVIAGIVIQPSGFFALLEAQRNGCGLFPGENIV